MLPEFSPTETPELALVIKQYRKLSAVASELASSVLDASSTLNAMRRELRQASEATKVQAAANVKHARRDYDEYVKLHAQAKAAADRAWQARVAIIEAQRSAWEAANPEEAHQAAIARMDHTEYHAKHRCTHRNRMRRNALSA